MQVILDMSEYKDYEKDKEILAQFLREVCCYLKETGESSVANHYYLDNSTEREALYLFVKSMLRNRY